MKEPQKLNLLIGIDPGANTGFAIWDCTEKKYKTILTLDFWECINRIESSFEFYGCMGVGVVIEDSNMNSFMYARHTSTFKTKIAQNVGMNKRDAQLIIEYCERRNIPVFPRKPTKFSRTGMKSSDFKTETGWNNTTSEHARDAAMLVFQHEPIIIR